jgi:uncharacterized protein
MGFPEDQHSAFRCHFCQLEAILPTTSLYLNYFQFLELIKNSERTTFKRIQIMPRIGLLSDTHGFINPRIPDFFGSCDEIWHAGDIGNIEAADKLAAFKPLKAVYGNIDGNDLRAVYPKNLIFDCGEVKVYMTHIGGYPGRYEKAARLLIESEKPGLFITGHSHILKVIYDKKYNLLHINPGAAGNSGFHNLITCIRFEIDGRDIRNLEVFEKQRQV